MFGKIRRKKRLLYLHKSVCQYLYISEYSRRKVVLKETELQHIHNQHSKPLKPF